jgi:hypothetical protein
MRHPIDFDGIKATALRSARQLLQELLPGGKFGGDEYVVRNPLRNDQHPGSFKINWKTGEWADFAIGKSGGDLISLVAYLRGISQVGAARELAAKVGIPVPKLSSANAEKRDRPVTLWRDSVSGRLEWRWESWPPKRPRLPSAPSNRST